MMRQNNRGNLSERFSFLDTKVGIQYCAQSEEIYERVLRSYLESANPREIENFYQTNDWKNYQVQVHALKSKSLSIGATELGEAAKAQESAVREERLDFVREHHEEVMEKYYKLIGLLQKELAL